MIWGILFCYMFMGNFTKQYFLQQFWLTFNNIFLILQYFKRFICIVLSVFYILKKVLCFEYSIIIKHSKVLWTKVFRKWPFCSNTETDENRYFIFVEYNKKKHCTLFPFTVCDELQFILFNWIVDHWWKIICNLLKIYILTYGGGGIT